MKPRRRLWPCRTSAGSWSRVTTAQPPAKAEGTTKSRPSSAARTKSCFPYMRILLWLLLRIQRYIHRGPTAGSVFRSGAWLAAKGGDRVQERSEGTVEEELAYMGRSTRSSRRRLNHSEAPRGMDSAAASCQARTPRLWMVGGR